MTDLLANFNDSRKRKGNAVPKKQLDASEPEPVGSSELRRIANLLALLAIKGETQPQKILSLTAAGFTPAEIATLLNITSNTVSVTIYQSKKKTAGKRGRKRNAAD